MLYMTKYNNAIIAKLNGQKLQLLLE